MYSANRDLIPAGSGLPEGGQSLSRKSKVRKNVKMVNIVVLIKPNKKATKKKFAKAHL
jgi:hypothetical protein